MKGYDTAFQAFRREWLHRLSNMDPDDLVCELSIDTDTLMDVLWFQIEQHIEQEYEHNAQDKDDEDHG